MEKLSVVLCTYNGTTHLPALLASLASQRKQPDELVVSDDGSTDATADLITAFARSAPFAVRWFKQEKRLGPAANFVVAAEHALGDWIAFCDQDDEWHPDKLARKLAVAHEHPDTAAVFCNARLVDVNGKPLGRTLWDQVGFTSREQSWVAAGSPWDVFVRHPVVSGAGLLIHARVRDQLAPFPDHWMHDAWAALVAAGSSRVISMAEPLFDYRQHAANVIGARSRTLSDVWETVRTFDRSAYLHAEFERWAALAARLESLPESKYKQATFGAVTAKLAHLRNRRDLPTVRARRWGGIAREWHSGGYRRYTKGWQPLLGDLLL